MLSVLVFVLAGAASEELVGLARASDRPVYCRAPSGLWDKARAPRRARYCNTLAKGQSKLLRDPERALTLAEEALTLVPGEVGAVVLRGQAELALDRPADAVNSFKEAEEASAQAFDSPTTDWAYARALSLSGKFDLARARYTKLVTRSSLLRSRERARLFLEAAYALVADEGAREKEGATGDGPGALGQALMLVRSAEEADEGPLAVDCALAEILIRVRQGDGARARARVRSMREQGRGPSALLWVADPADRFALSALFERDRAKATDAFERFKSTSRSDRWRAVGLGELDPTRDRPREN